MPCNSYENAFKNVTEENGAIESAAIIKFKLNTKGQN